MYSSPVVDVRSPSEYAKGHIPGAVNLPLFTDEERAAVGTCYKQVGRKEAFALGLEAVASKIEQIADSSARTLYCWRGGMRSQSVATFLGLIGKEVEVIPGGYKSFRRWVHSEIAKPRTFVVVTGYTGSGKTEFLHTLDEPVLDLEGLANHQGSSFGGLGGAQPSQEHFENLLAWKLHALGNGPIWVEDESRLVGHRKIPDPLFDQIQQGQVHEIACAKEERIKRLVAEYGRFPRKELIGAVERLQKRLGGLRTRETIAFIERGEYDQAVEHLLPYYDKAYERSRAFQRKRCTAPCD